MVKYDKNTFDLDLDPMTLILKFDLDMVKMFLYTKYEVTSYSSSKVIAWTDTQIDTQTDLCEIITYPHTDGKNLLFRTTVHTRPLSNHRINIIGFFDLVVDSMYLFDYGHATERCKVSNMQRDRQSSLKNSIGLGWFALKPL